MNTAGRRRLSLAWIVLPGTALLIFWTGGCARLPRGGAPPRNLLLLTLDTTRADHLSVYGGTAEVPNLERLARQGVRFDRAFAPSPTTLPSHASLFTGLYPTAHGVRNNGTFRLGDEAVTLAELLRQQGFLTAAIIGSQILDSRYGLDQGFELYDDSLPPEEKSKTVVVERAAGEVAERGLAWLKERGGDHRGESGAEGRGERSERWFLWLHFFDPHYEYEPPEPYRSRYATSPYDGEIAFVDEQAGRVLEFLRERGWLDETLVIAAGDHGESLGEHGEMTHGVFVYDATTHVPLLMRHPGSLREGARVAPLVRLVDVLPSALEILQVPLPAHALHGESLLPLVAGASAPPRTAWLESWLPRFNYAWSELSAVRDASWKYIRASRPELYDLAADAGETRNLSARDLTRSGQYGAALESLEAALRPAGGRDLARAQEIDAEMRESLAALGYITLAGPGPKGQVLPDPKDKIAEYEEMARAIHMLRQGREGEAIPIIEKSIAANPDSSFLHRRLGNAYRKMGRLQEGIRSLKRALELEPASFGALNDLGTAYFDAGELDKAEEVFRQVLRVNAHIGVAYSNLALIEMRRGRREAAVRLYERSLEEDPNLLRSLANLGSLYADAGRPADAIRLYLRLIELDPENEKAFFSAGYLLFKSGRHDEALQVLDRAEQTHPKSIKPAIYKAQVHQKRGDLAAAEREARSALARDPSSTEARRYLAAIEAQRRRLSAAAR